MEQFIEAMNEWYEELVEEQRAATPEVANQIRYALSHIADARRIVKRLVLAEEVRVVDELSQDEWTAFVEHANRRARTREDRMRTVEPVRWESDEPTMIDSLLSTFPEPTAVDDVMPSHPLQVKPLAEANFDDPDGQPYSTISEPIEPIGRGASEEEVHGDDAR